MHVPREASGLAAEPHKDIALVGHPQWLNHTHAHDCSGQEAVLQDLDLRDSHRVAVGPRQAMSARIQLP